MFWSYFGIRQVGFKTNWQIHNIASLANKSLTHEKPSQMFHCPACFPLKESVSHEQDTKKRAGIVQSGEEDVSSNAHCNVGDAMISSMILFGLWVWASTLSMLE